MKFSLTCDKEKVLYPENPHYGWQLCTEAQTLNFPTDRILFARDFIGKEVVLNSGGSRNKTLATSDEIRDDTIVSEPIPIEYSQENGSCQNSCVWLSACLVVRSVDVDLATILLAKYTENPSKFEWLRIFSKKSNNDSLYKYFQWTTECKLCVCRVSIPEEFRSMEMTQYILYVKKKGMIVAMLNDKGGNKFHTIGINFEKQFIYDCQEKFVLKFTLDNFSVCCGPSMIFDKIYLVAELK